MRATIAERTREAEVMARVREAEAAARDRRDGTIAWSWLARLAGWRKLAAGRSAARTAQARGDA